MSTARARWLIVGASGFLGSNLGWFLRDRVELCGLSRRAPRSSIFPYWHSVDVLTRMGYLETLLRDFHPTVVVNALSLTGHEACEVNQAVARRLNGQFVGELASVCQSIDARLIHISTDAVFDGSRGMYREGDEPSPFSTYGETKLVGESSALMETGKALVLRTNFFGWSPGGASSILEFFCRAAQSRSATPGYSDFIVTTLYVQQLAALIYQLAPSPYSGILHVASSNPLSKLAFGRRVFAQSGADPRLVYSTSSPGMRPGIVSRARDLSLDCSRLAGIVGQEPPSQEAGIAAAFADRVLRRSLS